MAREAWPNALNAQLFNSKVEVYFRGGLFPWGFISVGVYFRGGLFPWGFISVGVYFLSKTKWGFFPWGFLSATEFFKSYSIVFGHKHVFLAAIFLG